MPRRFVIIDVDEIDSAISDFIPQSQFKQMCLLSDKDDVEKMYKKLFKPKGKPSAKYQAWAEERIRFCRARREHAVDLETFLENMADMRLQELEELKNQRRNSIKRRLTQAGWEESDWTFPWQIARKWATLVEDPKPLTDRIWQNLYPKMVPYLAKNREFQTARFKADRQRRQNRRMRALLIEIQKRDIVLKVDRTVLRGETPAAVNHLEPYYDSDGGLPSEAENEAGHTIIFAGNREPLKVVISRPFPPMTDALALPIIQELLEDDTDTNTLEDRFEESREEVEEVLRSWGDIVERELVDMMMSDVDTEDSDDPEGEDKQMEPESDSPPLDLQFEVPSQYASFPDALKPETRLLLRADSVFRVDNDQQAPLPLYYPELFAILQDRTCGYFGNIFDYVRQTRPKLGYKWDSSQVKSYPEGVKAAKVLLKELGRPNATQFELQALGPRFTCGLCADKWVRNWNEMVQHYAEAFIHARLAEECTEPAKDSIAYNNLHVLDPASRSKGKNKPILIFHTAAEAKALTALERWDLRVQVKCNFCTDLGIEFLAPRQVIPKHIRAVHEFKTPKAEHRTKVYEKQEHVYIHTYRVKPRVSDSSSEDEEADAATMTERARAHGMAVYWAEWVSKGLESYDD
ncbi:hypothetical protein FRC09_014334 [Ceratobasidium sp. 395]|nr:hypothetical protein FRC09_014334 [Ceratobasidium sp. 395]